MQKELELNEKERQEQESILANSIAAASQLRQQQQQQRQNFSQQQQQSYSSQQNSSQQQQTNNNDDDADTGFERPAGLKEPSFTQRWSEEDENENNNNSNNNNDNNNDNMMMMNNNNSLTNSAYTRKDMEIMNNGNNNNQNNNMMNNNTSSNQQLAPPPYTAENVDASPIPPPPAYSSPSSSAIPVANNNTPNATNKNTSADAAATTATTDGAAKAKPPSFLQQLNKKDNRPIGKLEISKEDRSVTSIHLETKNVVNQQSMPIIDGVCPRQLFEIQQDLEQQYQTLFGNNNSNAVDGAAAKPLVAFAINIRENWEDHLSLFNGVDPMVRNIILSSEGTITYTKVNNNKKDYYVIIYGVNFKVGEHGPELVHLEKNLKKKDPNDEKKMIPVKGWHNITTLYFGKVGDKEDEFAFDTPDAERTMMVWIQGSPRVVQEICKKYKIDKKVSNEKLKNKMHNIHVSILVTTYKKILDEEKDTKFTIQDCEPMLSSANGANFHRGTLKFVPSASLDKNVLAKYFLFFPAG